MYLKSTFRLAMACSIGATTLGASVFNIDYTIGSGSELLIGNGGNGSILFADSADVGGGDPVFTGASAAASVLLPGDGFWNIGDTVSITGLAMPIKTATDTGTITFQFRQGAGGTGVSGAGDLSAFDTRTATFTGGQGTDAYYVNFDTPVTFVVDANTTTIGINFNHEDGKALRPKSQNSDGPDFLKQYNYSNGNWGANTYYKFSVAGNVTPVPEPGITALIMGMASVVGIVAFRRRRRV
jgi:hypothetical protein